MTDQSSFSSRWLKYLFSFVFFFALLFTFGDDAHPAIEYKRQKIDLNQEVGGQDFIPQLNTCPKGLSRIMDWEVPV
ncbi:hypothetical protein [Parabacteroides sp. PF5-6]|uniref:hypothetical protein n=1 Tax=Parabacteroides sp. PF5-6 TaxID=1742403 RepID=UPI002404A2D4|nr:hypothetical protein [Parabacteroides sp. PF5-6]MDF9831244.1 hypothetical protein [Parabacteroides sp. PF5-6]